MMTPGVLHEADVGVRTMHVACNLRANWCSFFELRKETAIARWCTMAVDPRFDRNLNAPLENILIE
jgi:hypothetical protein